MAASVIAQIMEERGLPAMVKWPNDVIVESRKLAGIIAESGGGSGGWFILGVGVNLKEVPEVPERMVLPAGAWSQFLPPPLPDELLSLFLSGIDECWPERESDPLINVRSRLLDRLWNMGTEVTVDSGG